MKDYHVTKTGKRIPIQSLERDHLLNIISWIERKAKDGLKVSYGGGDTPEDFHYDEYVVHGKNAKRELNYDAYVAELKRREGGNHG